MTNELKTLKDLCYNLRQDDEEGEVIDGVVRESELRAEAIRWAKDDVTTGTYPDEGMPAYKWIMHFFNIKEEELR